MPAMPGSDDYISVRDWCRKPLLRLRVKEASAKEAPLMTAATPGAHFEIRVDDGVVRTYRDVCETAIEAVRFLQQHGQHDMALRWVRTIDEAPHMFTSGTEANADLLLYCGGWRAGWVHRAGGAQQRILSWSLTGPHTPEAPVD